MKPTMARNSRRSPRNPNHQHHQEQQEDQERSCNPGYHYVSSRASPSLASSSSLSRISTVLVLSVVVLLLLPQPSAAASSSSSSSSSTPSSSRIPSQHSSSRIPKNDSDSPIMKRRTTRSSSVASSEATTTASEYQQQDLTSYLHFRRKRTAKRRMPISRMEAGSPLHFFQNLFGGGTPRPSKKDLLNGKPPSQLLSISAGGSNDSGASIHAKPHPHHLYKRSQLEINPGTSFLSGQGVNAADDDGKDLESPYQSTNNLLLSKHDDSNDEEEHNDFFNYALLIVLYTLQGIPMGLSASIPFLLQEKMKKTAALAAAATAAATAASGVVGEVASNAAAASASATVAAQSYHANAIFALCSWPFSLKLLWAPIVDALYLKKFGRRKTWLIPIQLIAGLLLVLGANFVEQSLGLGDLTDGIASASTSMNIQGVTAYFFVLYFCMATQDIAVDGWALTMLSKKNRNKGPICNSIGQNIGYFISFVGFLSLNDVDACNKVWRPLLSMIFPSMMTTGTGNGGGSLVQLKSFLQTMGYFMLVTTTIVAIFKKEKQQNPTTPSVQSQTSTSAVDINVGDDEDDDNELDASQIGLKETYHRLYAVCQLPAVRTLFLILITYRLPTSLSDNVKFLKAVEFGMSKSTIALLSPAIILPLGIIVPILATKIWKPEKITTRNHHGGADDVSAPLLVNKKNSASGASSVAAMKQFLHAYIARVTLIPILDIIMLKMIQSYVASGNLHDSTAIFLHWFTIALSTIGQTICNSLQFNGQMMFFASRVDPAIGGSYMTLLNTIANLGGTWPSSFIMWLISKFSTSNNAGGTIVSAGVGGRDPYYSLQLVLSILGIAWIVVLGPKVIQLSHLPDDAWRTHLLDDENNNDDDDVVDLQAVVGYNYNDNTGVSAPSSDQRSTLQQRPQPPPPPTQPGVTSSTFPLPSSSVDSYWGGSGSGNSSATVPAGGATTTGTDTNTGTGNAGGIGSLFFPAGGGGGDSTSKNAKRE